MLGRIPSQFIESRPADAARVLDEASPGVVGEVLAALPAPLGAVLLRAMTPHAAAGGLTHLAPDAGAALVAHLPVGTAAELLLRLDAVERGALMNALPAPVSVPLRLVLRFPAGSIGSLIDPRVVTVRPETRIGEAVESARRAPALLRKYLYVLDEGHLLTGVVDVRHCLLQDPVRLIGPLQRVEPVALRARAGLREASLMPAWERFAVLPAVDHRGVFLGVVRRRSLLRAIADRDTPPRESLAGLAVELLDLYWQSAADVLVGTFKEGHRD